MDEQVRWREVGQDCVLQRDRPELWQIAAFDVDREQSTDPLSHIACARVTNGSHLASDMLCHDTNTIRTRNAPMTDGKVTDTTVLAASQQMIQQFKKIRRGKMILTLLT